MRLLLLVFAFLSFYVRAERANPHSNIVASSLARDMYLSRDEERVRLSTENVPSGVDDNFRYWEVRQGRRLSGTLVLVGNGQVLVESDTPPRMYSIPSRAVITSVVARYRALFRAQCSGRPDQAQTENCKSMREILGRYSPSSPVLTNPAHSSPSPVSSVSPTTPAAPLTCIFSFYQTNQGDSSWFSNYAHYRMNEIARIEKNAMAVGSPIAYDTSTQPPLSQFVAPPGRNCASIYILYSGHGMSPGEPHATFIRAVRQKFPNYSQLVIEDTGCEGMNNPIEAARVLNARDLRPNGDQVHRFWGNQMHTGPVHTTDDSNTYYSWLSIEQRGSHPATYELWPCHSRNPCRADKEGTGFWCYANNRREPVYNRCTLSNAQYQWLIDPNQINPWASIPHQNNSSRAH